MFKLFRGSYTSIVETKGVEGLKLQLAQFFNKVQYKLSDTFELVRPVPCK